MTIGITDMKISYPALNISFPIPDCTQEIVDHIQNDFDNNRDSIVRWEDGTVIVYAHQWDGCKAVLERS